MDSAANCSLLFHCLTGLSCRVQVVRVVKIPDGVTVARGADVKDQIILEGNSIGDVSQTGVHLFLLFSSSSSSFSVVRAK